MFREDFVSACIGATCKEDCLSTCTDIRACIDDHVSTRTCTYVYAENMGVYGRMCPYISNKGTGMHIVITADESKVKTFVLGIMYAYDKYERY